MHEVQTAQSGILKLAVPIGLLVLAVILIVASWFHWRSTLSAITPVVIPLSESSRAHTDFGIGAKGLYQLYLEIPRDQLPSAIISNFGSTNQQLSGCVIYVALRHSTTAYFEANITSLQASVLAPDRVRFLIGSAQVDHPGHYTSAVDIASWPSSLTPSNSFFSIRRAAPQAQMIQQTAALRILFAGIVVAASLLLAIRFFKELYRPQPG